VFWQPLKSEVGGLGAIYLLFFLSYDVPMLLSVIGLLGTSD
jgi:hypothetical protein